MDTINASIKLACELAGSQADLARLLDVSPGLVNQWVKGIRPVPDSSCTEIERHFKGQVVCEDLLPGKTWVRVPDSDWPHPDGRPCIDPTKKESDTSPATPETAAGA